MDFRRFVSDVTCDEGLKVSTNVGQVSEVTKLILCKLAAMPMGEACAFISKYGAAPARRKKGR